MRKPVFILTLLLVLAHSGRSQNAPLEHDLTWRYEKAMARHDLAFHTSVKPFFQYELNAIPFVDTLRWPHIISDKKTTIPTDSGKYIRAQVLFDAQSGLDLADAQGRPFKGRAGGGFQLSGRISPKLFITGHYLYRLQTTPDYLAEMANRRYVLPSHGFVQPVLNHAYQSHTIGGYAHFTPSKHFNFQLGQGRNFFGDGYRSVLLSDNHYHYPYLKITTSFWRFRYVNLYAMMNNLAESDGKRSGIRKKFITFHYLSYLVNKKLTLSFFESVIWHAKDNHLMRGFDLAYLNPIILYRPVEFNMGSADNAIVGIGWKWKITHKINAYGQLLLDEFLLSRIQEDWQQFLSPNQDLRNGWWANKYAVQFGAKAFDVFRMEGLSVQSEFNLARPYTYSHGTLTQNYAHHGQPLAHPMGSNFYEWVNIARYLKNNWLFEAQLNHILHGENPSPIHNYGGDIFIPYQNRHSEMENFTGQGIQRRILYGRLRGAILLDTRTNLRLEGGYAFRQDKNDFRSKNTHFVFLGLRSALFNRYTDY